MFNAKSVYMPMPSEASARVNRRNLPFASTANGSFSDRSAGRAARRVAISGAVSISGAWALYPLAVRWQEEFRKAFPGVRVDVQAGGAGKGMADVLTGVVDIGMVSRAVNQVELDRGALPFAVAKDAVVATLSRRNPFLKELLERGLTRDDFRRVWVTAEVRSWEELLGREPKTPIHVFTRSDACGAAETWADFLGKKQEDLQGLGVFGDPGLVEAVRRDPLAIGYNNVNFAYDPRTKKPVAGVEVCPVDLDGDARLEPDERFYAGRDDLTAAIAAGRYPSPPARALYFVTRGRPRNRAAALFLKWALTEGQAFVSEMGYIALSKETIAAGLAVVEEALKEAR